MKYAINKAALIKGIGLLKSGRQIFEAIHLRIITDGIAMMNATAINKT